MPASIWNPAGDSVIVDPALRTQLISALGTDYVTYNPTGAGTVTQSLTSKLRGLEISPDNFGATGTAVFPGDTVAVQAAFNDGRPVRLTRNHYVDFVVISGVSRNIDFNGFSLIGCTTYSPDYCLAINCRDSILRNINVNANFKSYGSAIRWFSVDAGNPAQYNKVYGMRIAYSINGLTYGQVIGSASINAAQSENTIFGLTFRGVQNCFTGNQTNGFLTLVAPILDCNPYEWTASFPGVFNATNARCFNNPQCVLVILGGEILKTYTQLGYGFEGQGFTILGASWEIGCAWGLLTGDATIKDGGGYMASDSKAVFVTTVAAANCKLTLSNFSISRGVGVGAYSAMYIVDSSATNSFYVTFNDCKIVEWKFVFSVTGCRFAMRDTYNSLLAEYVTTTGVNILQGLSPYGNELSTVAGVAANSWTISNVFGAGVPVARQVASGAFPHAISAIELVASAGSTDFFTRFFRVISGKFLLLSFYSLKITGAGTSRFRVSFYDYNRVIIGATTETILSASTTVVALNIQTLPIPNTAAWVRFEPNQDTSNQMWYSELTAIIGGQNSLDKETVYMDAAPTVGVWMKGDRVEIVNPVATGYSGYVCTVAGSPGTWKGYGLIQA